MAGHNAVINTLAINSDEVLFSGGSARLLQHHTAPGPTLTDASWRWAAAGDNGSMCFWDVKSATCFQRMETKVQPGSLDSEMGIFASTFDRSGSRLITCEADKTIKIWKVRRHGPCGTAAWMLTPCGWTGGRERGAAVRTVGADWEAPARAGRMYRPDSLPLAQHHTHAHPRCTRRRRQPSPLSPLRVPAPPKARLLDERALVDLAGPALAHAGLRRALVGAELL
jgi:hypothetical protein